MRLVSTDFCGLGCRLFFAVAFFLCATCVEKWLWRATEFIPGFGKPLAVRGLKKATPEALGAYSYAWVAHIPCCGQFWGSGCLVVLYKGFGKPFSTSPAGVQPGGGRNLDAKFAWPDRFNFQLVRMTSVSAHSSIAPPTVNEIQ